MTFEELFALVAAHDGEITISFEDAKGEDRRVMGDVKECRIRAHLGRGPMGTARQRAGYSFVVSRRDAHLQRQRGAREVAHLREALTRLGAALEGQLHSPAEMLSRLAGPRASK